MPVSLSINGVAHDLAVEPRQTLVDVLRNVLQLTGTKKACGMGNCGACTVLLDGQAVYSCLVLGVECSGQQIRTIEGLADGDQLDPIQQAFIDHDALQCGFCTSGQIMNIKAYLDSNPDPDGDELQRVLAGNLCRCGAYPNIHAAAQSVIDEHRATRKSRK